MQRNNGLTVLAGLFFFLLSFAILLLWGKKDIVTLEKIEIIHGDDDQLVPINNAAKLSEKLIKNAQLKIYKGASHGLCSTHKNQINADLLSFISSAGSK